MLPLYVNLEFRGQTDHPLQNIRQMRNKALAALSGSFSALYMDRMGRLQQDNQDGDSATIKMKALISFASRREGGAQAQGRE